MCADRTDEVEHQADDGRDPQWRPPDADHQAGCTGNLARGQGREHPQWQLADHGATGQQALVRTLGVDPSVLVAMLNDLESAGLAERRRDPADRRRHIVEISPRGTQLVTDVYATIASVEADLFAALDTDEIDVLHDMLIRINATADGQSCDGANDAR